MAMRGGIPVPGKGDKMHASWGAAVASRVNELCSMAPAGMLARDGVGGMGAQPPPSNLRERGGNQLHPFAVRWVRSANEGEGGWAIWLPSDKCLMVAGEAVDVREGLTSAGAGNGWYLLPDFPSEGGTLYLNVHVPKGQDGEEETGPSAEFGTTAATAEDGEDVWPVAIAECADGTSRQNVMSAILLDDADAEREDCVKSLNELSGDVTIVGGSGISVEVEGQSIKISSSSGEGGEGGEGGGGADENDPCGHPEADGGVNSGGAGKDGGVNVKDDEAEGASGGGCSDCNSGSTTASAGGSPTEGASGKEAPAGTAGPVNGKSASPESSGGTSSGGTSSGSSGKQASSSSGLANYSTISKKTIGGSTHNSLTNSKTMNESPFKTSGNYKAIGSNATTPIYGNTRGQLYSNTHGQLTDSKTMNTNPWAAGKK